MALLFACGGGACRRPGDKVAKVADDDDGITRVDEDEDDRLATSVCVQKAQRSLEARRHLEALDLFGRALELRPDHPEALVGRAQALHRAGNWLDAEAACSYASAILPGNADLVTLQLALRAGPPSPAKGPELSSSAEVEVASTVASSSEQTAQNVEAPTVLDLEGMAKPAKPASIMGLMKADAPKPAAKKVAKKKVAPKKAEAKKEEEAPCPSSKTQAQLKKELRDLKAANHAGSKSAARSLNKSAIGSMWDSFMSKGERECKKSMFISFYREQYARLRSKAAKATVDTSLYSNDQSLGLSIDGGHRPMARPDGIETPPDFRKSVGTLTLEELNKYNCDNVRMLISVHGDIFDISDRPDKYGSQGPYWEMTGHDMTWGLIIGNDASGYLDFFYDVFKVPEKDVDRKLQGIMSWWAFYENEYGEPVGRLKIYDEEWLLPEPPEHDTGECSIM